MKLTEN